MKKILLLFSGAALSFLFFAYLDEYESLLSPFFSSSKKERSFSGPVAERITQDVRETIIKFNDALSNAYLKSDPSLLSEGPIDNRLIPSIAQEIAYLVREGKVMDIRVGDVDVENVEVLSLFSLQVMTREKVTVRYLSFLGVEGEPIAPAAIYRMRYIVERQKDGWSVLSFETRSVEDQRQR